MSTTSRSARTKRELLDAAWDLLARRGADASMTEIAVAAGVTRQSIHVHFRSRGGLLIALVQRADERWRISEQLDAALERPGAADRLDACLRVWFDFVVEIHPVALDLIRLRATDEDAARAWQGRMDDLLRFFGRLVDGLAEQDALADGWTREQASELLWATSSVQSWSLLVNDRGWRPEDAAAALRRMLAATLLAAPRSP